MGTLTVAPFFTYTSVEIVVQTSQDEIIANLNGLKALIPDPSVGADGTPPVHPDFGQITPGAAALLRAEIDALITAVDAMPIA